MNITGEAGPLQVPLRLERDCRGDAGGHDLHRRVQEEERLPRRGRADNHHDHAEARHRLEVTPATTDFRFSGKSGAEFWFPESVNRIKKGTKESNFD